METPPKITEIKEWILSHNPLGLAHGGTLSLKDIDPNPWSGHFNYLIAAGTKKCVLRFQGPEWGTPAGVGDEYENLKAVQKHRVGPKVFYYADDFFGEPMMCEEYLDGKPLNRFSAHTQLRSFPAIGRMIAKINTMRWLQNYFYCNAVFSVATSSDFAKRLITAALLRFKSFCSSFLSRSKIRHYVTK